MKQVVATILSLSVLVAGSALAAPAPVLPSAPALAAASAAPATAGSTVIRPQAPEAMADQMRPHKGLPGHRRGHAAGAQDGRHAHAGRHLRHQGSPRHGGPRQGPYAGHRGLRLGAPLAADRQGVVVTEHRRHGLQKAPRGQEWRRIGERYVRVTTGSNVVNEIVINGM